MTFATAAAATFGGAVDRAKTAAPKGDRSGMR
jgi:hypothetical protein